MLDNSDLNVLQARVERLVQEASLVGRSPDRTVDEQAVHRLLLGRAVVASEVYVRELTRHCDKIRAKRRP